MKRNYLTLSVCILSAVCLGACRTADNRTVLTSFPCDLSDGIYGIEENIVEVSQGSVFLNEETCISGAEKITAEQYGSYYLLLGYRETMIGAYDLAVFDGKGEVYLQESGVDVLTDEEKMTLTVYDPCLVHTEGCVYANQGYRNVTYSLTDMSVVDEVLFDYYLEAVKAEALTKGYTFAVCFVNVIVDDEDVHEAYEASLLSRTAPFIAYIDADHTVMGKGEGLWCIVPVKPGYALRIEQEGKEIYRSDDGKPVFLKADLFEKGLTSVICSGGENRYVYDPADSSTQEAYIFGDYEVPDHEEGKYFAKLYEVRPDLQTYTYEDYPFSQGLVIGDLTARAVFIIGEDGERKMYAVSDDLEHVYVREYVLDRWQEITE